MDIGTAIRTIRKELKISRNELALKTGMSANGLFNIENNMCFPSKETMRKICNVFNIPPAYLMFFSITDEDMSAESWIVFKALQNPLKDALLKDISNNK